MTYILKIKLASFPSENATDFCMTIVDYVERLDIIGVLKPDDLAETSRILKE